MALPLYKGIRPRRTVPIKDLRILALKTIAAYWQRAVDCMPDLKPKKLGKCDGPLEIDHIFGGGKRDAGAKTYRAIVNGERDLDYFRILCRKHNRQRINDYGITDSQFNTVERALK